MIPDELFTPYINVAMRAKEELNFLENELTGSPNAATKRILKLQIGHIKHVIDRCFRQTADYMPAHASQEAMKYFKENELGDIFTLRWSEQAKRERQPNRSTCKLKHEHKIPVSDLISQLRKVSTHEEALEIFKKQEIVWILKEEDNRLKKYGRLDPDQAYEDAKIKIVRNENGIGHLFTNLLE